VSRILAIANQKGGVGKTTTAINLGASLAVMERRVLLIDLDPQGNATTGLGIDRAKLAKSIYDVFTGSFLLTDVVCKTLLPYLFLAPATRDLIGVEIELVSEEKREERLRRAIEPLAGEFDYILIDCPPSLGLLTLNGLTAADALIAPLQCEYYALEGLSSLLETYKLVQKATNPSLTLGGILLTMFDSRNKLAHEVAEDVRRHFPDQVFRTVIHRNVRLSESPSHGKPALVYDFYCNGAQNYLELAKELVGKMEGIQDGEKGVG
jgi:chromosome partitioning protein